MYGLLWMYVKRCAIDDDNIETTTLMPPPTNNQIFTKMFMTLTLQVPKLNRPLASSSMNSSVLIATYPAMSEHSFILMK